MKYTIKGADQHNDSLEALILAIVQNPSTIVTVEETGQGNDTVRTVKFSRLRNVKCAVTCKQGTATHRLEADGDELTITKLPADEVVDDEYTIEISGLSDAYYGS